MSKFQISPENYTQVNASANSQSQDSKILLGKFRISKISKDKKQHKPSLNPGSPRFALLCKFDNTTVVILPWYDKYIISSNNTLKHIWDILMELILAYNLLTTLYFLAYRRPSDDLRNIDVLCWCFFVIDIFVTLISEYVNRRGNLIRNFKKILKHYGKKWLFVDVVSIIPLRAGGFYEAEYLLRMFRLLKLPLIIDFSDGVGLGYVLTYFDYGKCNKYGRPRYGFLFKIVAFIVKLIVSVVFIVYFLGCFWFWFQRKVHSKRFSSGESNDDNGFEDYFELESLEYKDAALRSSYFMLTTIATIGYGDFLPRNVYEMSFLIAVMLFGVTLFAFVSGSVNTAVSFYSDLTTGVDYLGKLNIWLNSIEDVQGPIPKLLKRKVIEHFKYYFIKDRLKSLSKNYWEAESSEDLIRPSQPYIKNLSEEVYFKILSHLYTDIQFIFRNYTLNSDFFYAIIPHFQPRLFLESQCIIGEFEDFDEIFFITKGQVSIGKTINEKFTLYLTLHTGEVIGDFNALTKKTNIFKYVAETLTDILAVPSSVFTTILKDFFTKTRSSILGNAGKRENKLKKIDTSTRSLSYSLIIPSIKHIITPMIKIKKESTDANINTQVLETIGRSERLRKMLNGLGQSIEDMRKIHKTKFENPEITDLTL